VFEQFVYWICGFIGVTDHEAITVAVGVFAGMLCYRIITAVVIDPVLYFVALFWAISAEEKAKRKALWAEERAKREAIDLVDGPGRRADGRKNRGPIVAWILLLLIGLVALAIWLSPAHATTRP
jgi:hypothetical protein